MTRSDLYYHPALYDALLAAFAAIRHAADGLQGSSRSISLIRMSAYSRGIPRTARSLRISRFRSLGPAEPPRLSWIRKLDLESVRQPTGRTAPGSEKQANSRGSSQHVRVDVIRVVQPPVRKIFVLKTIRNGLLL